jgi:hypothetical protein
MPKRKSVELNKIYNYALRISCKRFESNLKLGKILNFRDILFKFYTPIGFLG